MNFVFDIDGTTSFNGMVIEPAIEREIYALLRAGHRVVFASARPVRDILPCSLMMRARIAGWR